MTDKDNNEIAEEISWMAVVLISVMMMLSFPALVWAANYGPDLVVEMVQATTILMVVFWAVIYLRHLVKYNQLFNDIINSLNWRKQSKEEYEWEDESR